MTHEHLTLLRVLAIAAVALAGPPRWRPLRVALRLLLSRQVTVREYRTADLTPEQTRFFGLKRECGLHEEI